MTGSSKRNKVWPIVLLIAVLGFGIYGVSLNSDFLYDDETLVKKNIFIKSWSHIEKIFTEDIGAGSSSFYRPVQMLTYMADYSLWGNYPLGYHLTNILFHLLVVLAVYWLVNILFDDRILAIFTCVLFIVHPVHAEVVTYIAGRSDSLGMLFLILSLVLYIKQTGKENMSLLILMALSYIISLFSRESSLILPVLVLFYHYVFNKKIYKKGFFSLLGITALYVILRLTLLRSLLTKTASLTTLFERLPGFFAAVTAYIRLLVVPFDLHMEYGRELFKFTDIRVLIGMALVVLLVVFAWTQRKREKLIFFSVGWFFITLLPVSNLYSINAYMAEHWLYLPSVGFFLLISKFLVDIYRKKQFRMITVLIVGVLVAYYGAITIRQNIVYWSDPMAFYERTLKYSPDNAVIYNNLGNIYETEGENIKAIDAYEKAIELDPDNFNVYGNLGVVYKKIGKDQKAIDTYLKAIKHDPYNANSYNNLGNVYKDMKKYKEAINAYKKSMELAPGDPGVHYNLGVAYKLSGNNKMAISEYKKAVNIDPRFALGYINLSMCYFDAQRYDLAVKYCDLAVKHSYKVNPQYLRALNPHR